MIPSEMIRRARLNAQSGAPICEDIRDTPQVCVSRHTTYTRLMRNHDRVRTQHLRQYRTIGRSAHE